MSPKNMVTLEEKDRESLRDSIIEVEASNELYQAAAKNVNLPMRQVEFLFKFYMNALKTHKKLWIDILNKYVGPEDASTYKNLYRYDVQKNLIFLMEIEGCALCQGCSEQK